MLIDTEEFEVAQNERWILPASAGALGTPDDAVDMEMLASFGEAQIDGEPDIVVELIDLYLTDVAAKMGALRGALDGSDGPTLRRLAHCLRGSSGNLGAHRVAALCRELEHVGGDDWRPAAGGLLRSLERELERVEVIFAAERRGRTQATR
jgi:two-component system sensor histidine kinase/response regulator